MPAQVAQNHACFDLAGFREAPAYHGLTGPAPKSRALAPAQTVRVGPDLDRNRQLRWRAVLMRPAACLALSLLSITFAAEVELAAMAIEQRATDSTVRES